MSLKSIAKKQTKPTKSKTAKPEILVKGSAGAAIDIFVETKKNIKRLEGDLAINRPVIEEYAENAYVKELLEKGNVSSVKLRSSSGNSCTYIVQDRFSSSVFSDAEAKEEYMSDLIATLGKKASSLVTTEEVYTINPEVLNNKKVISQLSKIASKIEKETGEKLLLLNEKISVKKGAMEDVLGMTKKASKIKQALAILKPVTQLRG